MAGFDARGAGPRSRQAEGGGGARPGGSPYGYGYLWWIFAPDPRGKTGQDIYSARGRFGQYIIVVPEHDMVVVVFAMSTPGSGQDRTTELFYDRILTSVRR